MSAYIPTSISTPLTQATDLLRTTIGSITFGPALTLSKAAVVSLLSRIESGTLIITDQTTSPARTDFYGQKLAKGHQRSKQLNGNGVSGERRVGKVGKVELVVLKETFWMRLFLFGDMGFAEAYMLGEVGCADLTGFFMVRISPTYLPIENDSLE